MTNRQRRLVEFHRAMGQPILPSPQVPPDERVRLRLRLVAEECFEFLTACIDDSRELLLDQLHAELLGIIDKGRVTVDLAAVADALADVDYVVEGSRLEFGIDGEPIEAEVHRANMAKASGPVRPDGKRLKPPGWTPPDIAGCLEAQTGTKSLGAMFPP